MTKVNVDFGNNNRTNMFVLGIIVIKDELGRLMVSNALHGIGIASA